MHPRGYWPLASRIARRCRDVEQGQLFMESHMTLNHPLRTVGEPYRPAPRPVVNSIADALVDQIECGLVVCDSRGRLLHANRAARRELTDGRVLRLAHDALQVDSESHADLSAALHDAAIRQRSRLLWLGADDQQLMIVVRPIAVEAFGATPTALVVLGRRSLCSPLGLEMLAIRHGLTLAERRVFRGLIANRSAREIADAHGVCLPTVRTQIQSVREKVGVRSIDELLLRAAQVPPIGSLHECASA